MQPTLPFTFLYYRVKKESVEIKEIKKDKVQFRHIYEELR